MPPLKNKRHEKFLQTLPKVNFNATKAYKKVYHQSSSDSARSSAPVILASPSIQNRLAEILQANGLGEEAIKDTIKETRLANKPVICDGTITDWYPDHTIRLEAVKFASKIFGYTDKENQSSGNSTVNIQINQVTKEDMDKVMDKVNELRKRLTE